MDGPTPNGGVYSIAYFSDEDGEPCSEDKAARIEIHECDKDGNSIFRTYGFCDQEFNKQNTIK